MYEEIDEKTRFILRFIGILILSVLIPFIGFLLMGMMDMTNLDRFLSPHLLLFGGIVLIVVISVVDYFALKKYRRKFIAFFIVLNFVMAVPVFQWINDEWAFGPTTPEKKALVDLLGVPESYSALTILPPPVPKRSNGSHGVRISSSAYVGCYIYTTYEVFLLTDPAEIRVPLTFLKDPQENAFKDYEYLLRKTKKKGYEEMNVSESDLNDIEEH
ncbi:MAG: hypothetical protein U9N35_00140, partial [Euryarchaeota archaeon]|nr:hypothetical protein [Euryarchaeota archaeon]